MKGLKNVFPHSTVLIAKAWGIEYVQFFALSHMTAVGGWVLVSHAFSMRNWKFRGCSFCLLKVFLYCIGYLLISIKNLLERLQCYLEHSLCMTPRVFLLLHLSIKTGSTLCSTADSLSSASSLSFFCSGTRFSPVWISKEQSRNMLSMFDAFCAVPVQTKLFLSGMILGQMSTTRNERRIRRLECFTTDNGCLKGHNPNHSHMTNQKIEIQLLHIHACLKFYPSHNSVSMVTPEALIDTCG